METGGYGGSEGGGEKTEAKQDLWGDNGAGGVPSETPCVFTM
jgi:hypothetical protein